MAKVQGTCEDRFKEVEKLFQDVVDIWGGYANPDHSRPWEKDTIANVWSTTKTVTNLAALVCIDRGLLDPYEKVSKYWPEFGANGKENIEVRHLLSHASGLSGWQEPMQIEDFYNLEKSTAMLAAQAPWWEPGTASGYHSQTLGPLVGEVVRRVTGKSLRQFIAEDLAMPLHADFQLGLKDEDVSRAAEIVAPPPMDPAFVPKGFTDPASITFKTFLNPFTEATLANSAMWRKAELGAVNGHSNARGVAHVLTPVSLGGGGLLSPKTIDLIFKEQTNAVDLVLGQKVRFGIGYALSERDSLTDFLPEGRVCTWGGWGGSIAIMDLDRKVTITYVMKKMDNAMLGNERAKDYVRAIYKALGVA